MSLEEPTHRILLVGQHPDLSEKASAQLRAAGFHVDVIPQWFRELPSWPSGKPDLVIAHAQAPSDRFGVCQLLGKFTDPPPAVSIATGPTTVPGCSYSLRYPLVPHELDLVVRAALREVAEQQRQFPQYPSAPGQPTATRRAPLKSSRQPPHSSREITSLDTSETRVEFEIGDSKPVSSTPSVSLSTAPIAPALSHPSVPLSSSSSSRVPLPSSVPGDERTTRAAPPELPPKPKPARPEAAIPQKVVEDRSDEVLVEAEPDPALAPPLAVPPPPPPDFLRSTDHAEDSRPSPPHPLLEQDGAAIDIPKDDDDDDESFAEPALGVSASTQAPGELETSQPEPDPEPAEARVWRKENSDIEYRGDLRGYRLADLLHHCSMHVKTGIITLQREGHRKRIYLQQGAPIYVDSILREETLGAFLLKRDVISSDQHRIAIAKMSGSGKRLGEVLIEMKVLKAKEAFRHLSEHIQSKVISAFGWNDGTYNFKKLPRLPPEVIGVPMNSPNLVVQGMRAHFNPAYLPPEFPAFDSASGVTLDNPAYNEEELGLSPTASNIRTEVESGTSIASLVDAVGAPVEQVMGVVYALYALQVIALSDQPGIESEGRPTNAETSAAITLDAEQFEALNETCDAFLADYLRLRPLDCFRLLGLDPEDDDDDSNEVVDKAFDALKAKLAPECFDANEITAVAVKVHELWTQIFLAHRTLSTREGRDKYRRSLAQAAKDDPSASGSRGPEHVKALAGESQFQEGRLALSTGDLDKALEAFDKALESAPTEPSYLAHRAWTMYTIDPKQNRQHAIAELNTTRSLDSSYSGVSYFLGRICLDDEANDIALGYFEMALRADPDFREAQHYLQLTKSKIFAAKRPTAASEKTGRLSRLFRRKK